MPKPEPKDRPVRKKKAKAKAKKPFKLSYSFVLLILMVIVGTIAGLYAYGFGKKALQGVKTSPTEVKLPKLTPKASPSPSASPKKPDTTSFLLDENQVILASQTLFNEQLGGLTRKPRFPRSLIQNPLNTRLASIRNRLGLPRYREIGISSLFQDRDKDSSKETDLSRPLAGRDSTLTNRTNGTRNVEFGALEPPAIAQNSVQNSERQTIESLYSPIDPPISDSAKTRRLPALPSMPSALDDNMRAEPTDLLGYPQRSLHLRSR
jgi:hypothetical protein